MKRRHLFLALPAALIVLGSNAAIAGKTTDGVGALACVTDTWTEKDVEKGHKLANWSAAASPFPTILPRRNARKNAR